MAKRKSVSKHSRIHESFPAEGQTNPSYMGSQSMAPASPTTPEQLGPQAPGNLPMDYTSNMQAQGEY